jgi:hypothetical protein
MEASTIWVQQGQKWMLGEVGMIVSPTEPRRIIILWTSLLRHQCPGLSRVNSLVHVSD